MKSSEYKDYLTVLNVISAVSVVALHANNCFWSFSRKGGYWFSANIIECLFYFAVPVFIMITGITLFDYTKRYDTRAFLKHRFNKTVIPFVFWSLMALLVQIFYLKKIALSSLSVSFIINGLFKSSFTPVYWLFIPLFSLYFCIPLFASIDETKKTAVLKFLAVSGFIINILLPFVFTVCRSSVKIPVNVTVVGGFIFYAVLGWLLDRYNLSHRQRKIIYILSVVGLAMHICGTYVLSMEAGKIIKTYKGYSNIPCILYTTGIFVFIKQWVTHGSSQKQQRFTAICDKLKNYSFSVYLLHWFFIKLLVKEFDIDIRTTSYRIGGVFLLTVLSIMAAWLIRKIPIVGKRILP